MRKPTARPGIRPTSASAAPAAGANDQTFGTPRTVEWITGHVSPGRTISTAIPPVFERFAVFVEVDTVDDALLVEQEHAVVRHLADHGPQEWWLGYLDTGAHDVVFPEARKVSMYAGWPYVIVKGGPEEALTWRDSLPDLIFPVDRSWLMSMLWDDGWTCVGGPVRLVDDLVEDALVGARRVGLGVDVTPPGHLSF